MRSYFAPALLGSVLLMGSPAAFAATVQPGDQPAAIRVAANDDWAAKKQEYEARAQAQLDEWRADMDQMTAQAKAKSQEYSASTRENLDHAWADAKVQWAKLKEATAEDWDKARISFESASARMKKALHDIQAKNE
jgi:hypothetical protein